MVATTFRFTSQGTHLLIAVAILMALLVYWVLK
jgi:hypothetical protein